MMTRKQFGGKLLSAVAAGSLANYSLVANAMSLSSLERGLGDKCNESGKSDQCHGMGAKTDTDKPEPPAPPDPEPPSPRARAPSDRTPGSRTIRRRRTQPPLRPPTACSCRKE